MGASSSRVDEDKALQLCRERKKFVRQALDGRCALAATHFTYIQSLKITGTALRRFVESECPTESSLYTSTSATPEPVGVTDKSLSQFSLSSPSLSQHVDATENCSPSHSPPPTSRFQANHMKVRGSSSRKVEEKLPVPVLGSLTSSSTLNATLHSSERPEAFPFNTSPNASETPPWDFFGLYHPIDNHFSSKDARKLSQRLVEADEIKHSKEEERVPSLEGEEMKDSCSGTEELQESEDEFDDPYMDELVRSFENVNRATDNVSVTDLPTTPLTESVLSETEFLNEEKCNSPTLSPLRSASGVVFPGDVKTTLLREDGMRNKVSPKDFFSGMKDIEYLFIKASDSGREVPRMLEANKFHFRPIFPGKEGGSMTLTLLKSCFSCGEDPSQVQEEPSAQTTTKYLTWHRTTSSRSSSSRNHLGENTADDIEDLTSNLFDNFCMVSGSHASTLDRLHAWERKLYDEVKASGIVRKDYDQKRKLLRQLESNGESSNKIDKTRAVVKDLHSRIRVAIHRIDSISKKIEDLRDKELQPQLEELIEGLRKMWEVMFECHKLQFNVISVIGNNNANYKISLQSESRRQITIQLENDLGTLSSSFMKWIEAQKAYVQAIDGWLFKCISLPQIPSKRKRRVQTPSLRNFGPPIYVTCGVWLEKLNALPSKGVVDSIRALAAEISHFLPRQEIKQGKGINHTHSTSWHGGSRTESGFNMRDEVSENWITGFDHFRSSLVDFLGQLNGFAGSCVKMFVELQENIEEAKRMHK